MNNLAQQMDTLTSWEEAPESEPQWSSISKNVRNVENVFDLQPNGVSSVRNENCLPSNFSNPIIRFLQNRWQNSSQCDKWEEPECIAKSVRELSEKSSLLIGENGVDRFKKFIKLKKGWDGDEGKILDSQSVASFECFVGCCEEIIPEEPSIFLSNRGYLQLGWEDAGGNKIEVEFFPRMIQYFNEADGREIEVPIEKLNYAKKYIFSDGTDRV